MSWRDRQIFVRATIVVLLASTAVAATANVLVVRSQGAAARAYPPGTSLPDNASLRLAATDSVTVLGPSGTRTFRGPGSFRVAAPAQATSFSRAMPANRRRAQVGAVRGGGGPAPTGPSLWYVDVSRGGLICLPPAATATLWRPNSAAEATLSIAAPGSAGTRVTWPAGHYAMAWPREVPMAIGTDYQLRVDGTGPLVVRFKPLSAAPSDRQDLAALFIREGCQSQLDLLLATAPQAAE